MFYAMHHRKPPFNHYEFIKSIALAWIDPDTYWPQKSGKRDNDASSSSSSRMSKRSKPSPKRNATFTDRSLDPYTGSLRCRMDTRLNHLPEENDKDEGSCQMHYWKDKSKYRKQLLKCAACQVTLCVKCYKTFHDTADLMNLKE